MLSYALAIAVATSSLVLFLTAFLMSDIHRKDDFLWSGVGLIYALVLWYCARNITGAVLLGQAAATALLVSYSWQTLKLRRAIANPDKAAEINNFSVLQKINGLLKRDRAKVQPTTPAATTVTPKVTEQEIAIPDTPAKDTVETPASGIVEPKKEVSTAPVTDESATVKDLKTDKDTVETPASGIVEPKKEVSTAPVTNESATVKDLKTEPELSEAQSLGIKPGDRVSNVKPVLSQPAEEDTSTQNTEIITQPVKPKVVVQDKQNSSVDSAKNIEVTPVPDKSEAKTEESADTVTGDRPQVSDQKKIEPEPQPTTEEPLKVEPVTKTSQLDSLETVEVAEVLEAAEDSTINLDTDRSNIIEVTTTEINITTEVKKLEQPEDDFNPQEK